MSPRLVCHSRKIDDAGDLLRALPADAPVAWVREGDGMVGWGEAFRFDPGTGGDRFRRAEAALAEWFGSVDVDAEFVGPGTGPVAWASFTFDPEVGGSCVVVPRVVIGRRAGISWRTVVGPLRSGSEAVGREDDEATALAPQIPAPTRVRYAGASVDEVSWLEAVDRTARVIRSGELAKVVLARDLEVWSAEPLDTRILARRLADRFATCWTFLCDGLVGATPELLVRRTGTAVESTVLAGSAPRGKGSSDSDIGADLLTSRKDRVEHTLAVASVVDRLAGACTAVRADTEPWLLRLANVQHLASNITATLHRPMTALGLAGLLHPTAAVGGTPTQAALDHIRAVEGMDRGRYSGPVGWVDARGDGEFGIALRCAEVDGSRARLFSGAGIVGESLPEAELEETRLKLRAMQSALEGTAP